MSWTHANDRSCRTNEPRSIFEVMPHDRTLTAMIIISQHFNQLYTGAKIVAAGSSENRCELRTMLPPPYVLYI